MNIAFGVTWGERKRPHFYAAWSVALVVALTIMGLGAPKSQEMAAEAGRMVSVIVQEMPGVGDGPERAVEAAGGEVGRQLGIINAFEATVPSGALARLETTAGVRHVTINGKVRLLTSNWGDYQPVAEPGSLFNTANIVRAREFWKRGFTGSGVDVALIDSGVAPVPGLNDPNKVVNGPDLSFETSSPELRYLDTFGHGTHMAGIIAGNSSGAPATVDSLKDPENFMGIAPDARIVSVKVAQADGATDVSQVIAAIDWVVQHRNDSGLNIRVLNLSFGTDGIQPYLIDPLAYAAEVAWHKGIVVVVAAGNDGYGNIQLNNPALDPFVLAVGADDPMGTVPVADDVVPDFSSKGNHLRNPDLIAPGKSIASLRVPGSYIDQESPGGRAGIGLFKGSGTSQSAAVVSGAAALVLSHRPNLSPDQVKFLMVKSAERLPRRTRPPRVPGFWIWPLLGRMSTPLEVVAKQRHFRGTGLGSLELARGSAHVVDENGNELTGEQTIFGDPWDGLTWSRNTWSGNTWSGGDWMRNTWSGNTWSGNSWSGLTWSGITWSRNTWSGNTWSRNTWSGNTWSGNTWSGNTWSGNTWSGNTWSRNTWSGNTWSGNTWSGSLWE